MGFKSGFIAIFGRPNTGKTTLVNRLSGFKVGITSAKPQTTRHRIMAVCTDAESQMIFLDTPGYVAGSLNLPFDLRIRECALQALKDVDLILPIFDASRAWGVEDETAATLIKEAGIKAIPVLNKTDLLDGVGDTRERLREVVSKGGFKNVLPLSALTGEGLSALLAEINRALPEGPLYYPEDTLTDQPSRFIASEMVREQLFLQLEKEVPYGCAVVTEFFREDDDSINIEATIIVERDSLKGIVIGKKGARLKEVGTLARKEIENAFNKKVHLELFVKVHKNWRRDLKAIKEFGY